MMILVRQHHIPKVALKLMIEDATDIVDLVPITIIAGCK